MNSEKTYARNVNENPCNMCMPMGGIIPFKGIEQSMVLLHGSQGCATYMRRHIAEHFNEPVDVGSSSLNEKGTVYGGEKNLKQGLDNIIKLYNPKLIGILTTCLAETIGEDVSRISSKYLTERGVRGVDIVPVSTPGYGDSHAEGYWVAARAIVAHLAKNTSKHRGINIIVPNISCADIREIKRILDLLNIDYILFPDYSDTLDAPFVRPYRKIPRGGTRLNDMAEMGGARATIQFGITASDSISPGKYLETEFGVPLYNLPIPMGIESTDMFIRAITDITGKEMPESMELERGRLLDCMVDSHKYNFGARSVIFGDPELVYAMTKTCLENGIIPVVAATGSKSSKISELLETDFKQMAIGGHIQTGTDFASIRAVGRSLNANIAIGHSDGRYLTEKEGIPLIRMGFPILDRMGGQRIMSVGYTGTALFIDRITNTLLECKHKNYRSSMYEKYYRGNTKWEHEKVI